jgi:hypothetical protein
MNERIRELALQAQKVVGYTDGGYTEIKALDQEKFAELIVRECIGVCEEYHGTAGDQAAQYIGQGIKEHFGVEE